MTRMIVGASLLLLVVGCAKTEAKPKPEKKSIMGQKTQDIGEFDANAGREVSDSKVRVDDPILGPLQAYGPLAEQTSKLAIQHNLDLFHATNGRYPKDHEEFMTEIIKRNNIRLPVLPAKHEYQYDVENHELVVVKPPAEEK